MSTIFCSGTLSYIVYTCHKLFSIKIQRINFNSSTSRRSDTAKLYSKQIWTAFKRNVGSRRQCVGFLLAEYTLARCGTRYNMRYDTLCDSNATCIARKHRKCTEAAKQVHAGTIATRQRHMSVSYHSRGHGVLVFYDQCRSECTPGQTERDGNARGHIIDDFIHQTC
jgi:hypothetical protein